MGLQFQLAMGQMRVRGAAVGENLGRAARFIRDAAARGCALVVLPECLDVGWSHPRARELAQPIPGPHSDALARAAREAGIHVVAGITERCGDRVYNAAVLIGPDGSLLARHRKINTLVDVETLYATGDSLSVAATALGTVGVDICADNFPDSLALGHALARMGARLLASPSAWAVTAERDLAREPYGARWRESYATLARLYDMTVVGVSNVGRIEDGPWKGRKCIGCSLAIGPGGKVLAEGPGGEDAEALVVVPVEMFPPAASGTAIAPMLKAKGYEGP